jgi:ABC-type antimicrobial peptide transport system permease subunit
VVLQTDDPGAVVAAVPNHLADRVVRVATGREIVARDIARQRLGAWAFSGFGLVTLLLGIGGVFGLVAYLAQARRREFGVRMALGATPSDVVRNAVAAALGPVTVGVAAGLLIGAVVSRVFAALLVGIDGLDPGTYAGVALVMLVSATVAALAAARRLRRLTPSEAFRRASPLTG